MNLTPFHIIGFSLPTLTLLYALATPAVGVPRVHRELYGNGVVQFEARFTSNPDGWLRRKDAKAVPFSGIWAEDDKEIPVEGLRYLQHGNAVYEFSGAAGAIRGERVAGKKGCPPELHFEWRSHQGQALRQGALSSGPCYPTWPL